MTIALLAALLVAPVRADDSARPYVLVNGRAVASDPASRAPAAAPVHTGGSAPVAVPAGTQKSAFGSNQVAPSVYSAPAAAPARQNSLWGKSPARSKRGVSPRRGAAPTPAGTGSGGSGDQAPPNYSKPGALIRSEGQLPQYSKADGGGTHSVEGGGFVGIDQSKAHDVGRGPGIGWAPPDKTPPPNPTSGGAGGNGATTNPGGTTIINNDHSNNTNGNGNGGGNGNSPTGFDPTF